MISGIHLATALSVMLHMEEEGNEMETKEIASKLTGMAGIETSALYSQRVVLTAAADRLSEQQQVIDELVSIVGSFHESTWDSFSDEDQERINIALSRAKGVIKDDE